MRAGWPPELAGIEKHLSEDSLADPTTKGTDR
jgi:hypothetical protein